MTSLPVLQTTASAASYRDPARYARERTSIFGRSWLFMAHTSELQSEGDVVTATIAGFPLLVVRNGEGIKGFHNVCRHRAGPLMDQDRGNCSGGLVCKYHGWAYTLDGRLRNARDFGAAAGFDPRNFGLMPLVVETWRNFVFVNADLEAAPLMTALSPLDRKLGDRKFEHLVHAERRMHDIACNWKIYVENYLEGYHIPNVHPMLNAQVDAQRYEVTVEGAICFHNSPPRRKDASVYDGVWAFALPHLGVNSYGEAGVMMERMLPMGPDATRLVYDYYLPELVASNEQAKQRIIETSAIVTAEDKWICEKVQVNIDAGIYHTGVLSPKHEAGVGWFQKYFSAAIDSRGN
ncbi:MAG: SRPBCC family protein [Micropepsaceae bacterium]